MPNPSVHVIGLPASVQVSSIIAHATDSTLQHIVESRDKDGAVKTRCGRTLRHWSIFPYGVVTLEYAAEQQFLCPRCGDYNAFAVALGHMVSRFAAYRAAKEREQAALYKARSDALCTLAEALIESGFDIEVGAVDTARTFTINHEGSTFGVIVKKAADQPEVGK